MLHSQLSEPSLTSAGPRNVVRLSVLFQRIWQIKLCPLSQEARCPLAVARCCLDCAFVLPRWQQGPLPPFPSFLLPSPFFYRTLLWLGSVPTGLRMIDPERSPNDARMVPELSLNGVLLSSGPPIVGFRMIPEWSPNGPQMIPG